MSAAVRNPTRHDLVERIEELIAEYNAGSLNIDEYLRRLVALSGDLSEEERRAVTEDMSEEELAIFDLLTHPDPVLDDVDRETVKAGAKRLLEHLHDKLVLDWRRRAATVADVRVTIKEVLDDELPADPYPPEVFDAKVQAVFDHVISAYGDDGSSVYGEAGESPAGRSIETRTETVPDLAAITEDVVARIKHDAEFASLVAEQLGLSSPALRTVEELIKNDEDDAVEFKSTARWDVREAAPSKLMEDALVKTVAGFLNTGGGTLLIGVGPDRQVVGLDSDYQRVKPSNGDGFVNWLTTHLINALDHTAASHVRARIVEHEGVEICRIDVGRSLRPLFAKTSTKEGVFFMRLNNSTRVLPVDEQPTYITEHWPPNNIG